MKINEEIKRSPLDKSLQWIFLLGIFILFGLYLLRVSISGHFYGNTDFYTFYQSMRFYFSGQNIYSPVILPNPELHTTMTKYGNLNPPFLTALLLPLCYFNYAQALFCWTVISLGCLILSAVLILKEFKQDSLSYSYPHSYRWPIIFAIMLYVASSVTVSYGQVSNLLLLLMTGSWIAGRKKCEILSGILISIACSIKLFCGLFLLYFLFSKQLKAFLSASVSGIIILFGTIFVFGVQSYKHYLETLIRIAWYGESWSVSFKSFFLRVFSPTEKNYTLFNAPHAAEYLTVLCSLLLLTGLIISWIKLGAPKNLNQSRSYFDIGFSLVIPSMLLLSPLGWSYYFNFLLIPYFILIHESRDDRVHLGGCILILINSLSGDLIKTYNIKNAMQIFINGGLSFYVLIIFVLALFRMTYQKTQKTQKNYHLKNKSYGISPVSWGVIYVVVLLPSVISQAAVIKNMIQLSAGFT